MKHLVQSLVASILTAAASVSQAAYIEIDFNDLAPGVPLISQYPAEGVMFSLLNSPFAGPFTYPLEDPVGTPVNIFGADGNAINPGDDTVGPYFDIQMSFDTSIDYFSILGLDAEEVFSIQAFQNDSLVTSTSSGTFIGDHVANRFNGPVFQYELGGIGGTDLFDRIVLTRNASSDIPEVFHNLAFDTVPNVTPIPLPPTAPLIGSALGMVGFSGWRKRKQR